MQKHAWASAIWVAVFLWAVVLFLVVRERYAEFRFGRHDLGNMVQAVWNTAHGRLLETTLAVTGEQVVRLGGHVDPILAGLAPFWMIAPSPLALAAVQIVAVAAGALPVFWLGRRHLNSERAAAMLALAYLTYPWIAWTAVDAIHPVTLAIPLLLFCVWYLDTDRLAPFALCAVLAAASGELMGIVLAALGVWYALARGRRRAGLLIAGAGLGWTLLALYAVVPAFSGGESVFYGLYDDVGGSPLGIVKTAFTDPGAILSAASESRDVLYLLLLAAPLSGVFLLGPALAAVTLPQVVVNVLADDPGTTDPHEHYVAAILPFVFAAVAVGLARFSPVGRVRGAALVLVGSTAATIAVGPWPGALLGAPGWGPLPDTAAHIRVLEEAVATVPAGASVSATNRIGAHLAARRYSYSVPVVGRARWIVLESSDTWIPQSISGKSDPERLRAFQERIESSPEWRKVFEESGVFVYRRTTP